MCPGFLMWRKTTREMRQEVPSGVGVQGMDQNHTEEYSTGLEWTDPCFRTRPLIFWKYGNFYKNILPNSRRSWCKLHDIGCRMVPCVAAVLGPTLHRNKYRKTQRQAWLGHFPHRRQSVWLLPSTAIGEWPPLCIKSTLFSESQKNKCKYHLYKKWIWNLT